MTTDSRAPNAEVAPAQAPGARSGLPLPLIAFGFVVLAFVALALLPTIMLRQVTATAEDLTAVALPAMGSTNRLALAMEERVSAARSLAITQDSAYERRLERARRDEILALRELARVESQLGPAAAAHARRISAEVDRRDALEARLVGSADPEDYRAAMPLFDALTDSIDAYVDALRAAVSAEASQRVEHEIRLLERQRQVASLLSLVALAAALTVGWFAWTQRRLRRELARALDDANRLRLEAEQRRELLERVTESRTRLMRGFTHDVKNPLGAASGHLDLLAEGIHGPLSDEQAASIGRARASIGAALSLVEDLLELARAESGHLDVQRAPTDLLVLVREVVEEYRAQADAKGLTVDVDLPAELPTAHTDARRVRQVLGNLLSNAVKYTREGGIRVSAPHAAAAGPETTRRVAIHVDDTGPGIAAEKRPLLFQEFTRLDPTASKGTGVGLAISRRIALALGGEITVESEPGRGSRFTLWVPTEP